MESWFQVPGGFGHGSEESKAKFLLPCAMYARENKCSIPRHRPGRLGMQVAIIELARSVPGLKDANSAEFDAGARYILV